LQDPPKFTKIGIFGLKTNHLATLDNANISANRRYFIVDTFTGTPIKSRYRLKINSFEAKGFHCLFEDSSRKC
jgi:hypothetical protein